MRQISFISITMTLRDFQRDFNKNFGQNFNKVADFLESLVTDMADQISSPGTKKTLNSALDLFRPHFISLGVRIAILSPTHVELTLPMKARSLDEQGEILPGVQISAAIEAYKLLWKRNAPEGEFQIVIKSAKAQFFKSARTDLHLRGELSEISRESRRAELSKNKRATHEMTLNFYDDQDQIVTEVEVKSELLFKEMLEWK